MRRLPLVGREHELAALRSAVVEQGGAVLAGGAGVGKTRLAGEVTRSLDGWFVAWACATAAARDVPLGGIAALGLRSVGAGGDRTGLLSRLVAELRDRAGGRPAVLVVDDAHLLDDLSGAFVHQVAASGAAAPLLCVRTGEQPPPGIVALAKDGGLPRVELQPLGPDEVGELAGAAAGGPVDEAGLAALWDYTGGDVLFLCEVLDGGKGLRRMGDGWTWERPTTVEPRLAELVEDRMGRLAGARRVLAEVLAAGEPLGAAVVEAVTPGAHLADEEGGRLVTVEVSGRRADVRLAHPLYGEVVRSRLPPLRRRRILGQLAEALDATGGRRQDDGLRSAVWRLESATATDATALARAAGSARQAFDPALAVRLAEASLDLGPSFDAALALGGALADLGRLPEAEQTLDRLVGTEPDGAGRQRLARERAAVLLRRPEGLDAARRVLEEAEAATEEGPVRLSARNDLALAFTYYGRPRQAVDIGAPLLEPGVDDRVRLGALPAVGACLVLAGRTDRVLALCDELEPVAADLVHELPRAPGLVWQMRSNALFLSGRVDDAVKVLEPPLAPGAAPLLGEGDLAYARTKLGRVLLLQGRPRAAAGQLAAAAEALDGADPNRCLVWCLSLAAEARALLGDVDEAGELARRAAAGRAQGFAVFDGDAARARAWTAVAAGERTRAVRELVAAGEDQLRRDQPALALFAFHDAVRLGDRQACARVEQVSPTLDGPWPRAAAERAAGTRHSDPERLDGAAAGFAAAGLLPYAAEAASAAGLLWAGTGHPTRGGASGRAAGRWLARCEVVGAAVIDDRPTGPGLTRREREVAALAARGLSNAEVADRLVVSVRTVESHLYSVYAKLGVSDRRELAAVIGSQ